MTKAKAASVASSLINLDYSPTITKLVNGDYQVTVETADAAVTLNSLKTFQDNNTITGRVRAVDFT